MREKFLVTDPNDVLFTPKTLESFLSQKRTAQTGFCIAVRLEKEPHGVVMTLWFSSRWHTRIEEEFEGLFFGREFSENSWRMKVELFMKQRDVDKFLARCSELGYDLTQVRSFRRFTR